MFFSAPAWQSLRRHWCRRRCARYFTGVLCALYLAAAVADFLAPHASSFEDRRFRFAPPARVRVWHEGRLHRPFIYALSVKSDQYRRTVFTENTTVPYPIRFFVRDVPTDSSMKPLRLHLFGTDEAVQPFYLLGADSRGRDIFSRLLYGARVSLTVGLLGAAITLVLGTVVGCIAGYCGGLIDTLLMRLCEMLMLVPAMYLLLALRALIPVNVGPVQMYLLIIVLLSFISWAGLARVLRGMTRALKEKEWVLSARALGQSASKIVLLHILPHLTGYLVITAFFSIPMYILGESVLSFLGLGLQEPAVSWGSLLKEAGSIAQLRQHPWLLFPMFALLLTIIAFNVLADFLRDALDPQYRQM